MSDFNARHSRKHHHEVQFCAPDILVVDGEDIRKLPLSIFVNPFERGEISPELVRVACRMGLRVRF
ncbi:hypothetical protein [uncultured Bradyrhizobium sp.]|uniref:hypothetical protein n=1 Tax=uncultured Bradyrhizobium sp. TaxID=199684 RepID=UPI00260A89D6|nr:hypothetical protein [uncultured Bradyrhizobium sp.]